MNIMKRAIIVHCWGGNPEYCWYPQTKKELEEQGFEVMVPAMPDTEHPKQSAWVPVLREVVGTPTEETYLIGHSCSSKSWRHSQKRAWRRAYRQRKHEPFLRPFR
ncbi:MAG: hypothetical protein A2940_00990 [Candidatus Wildermuthbacteria bacterium RIFCSPLOWO2_01_FULL_48_29]|uniref:AB hydrolase-1 domain-containing protein n=2 Tax=Candidatus Wildermuthiibacteriota TaxID=1817923 RepID=A0A1G2RKD8_9BACT|nr:MAG: hypothetical protein A2843_01095 [Candidatus Wildermuthbacteria bacterium RIFCSPHIGHO2_01_FULL_48_27b]OHA73286.1 MAG: hypothetical protein A2940_00990 [Candidatus Wildermuthbacteria bacterium RIFCSPLOWO2_01_FULL_48_29]